MHKKSSLFGVDEVRAEDELRPTWYSRSFDLTKEGIPWIPAVGIHTFRRYNPLSPWHVHKGCLELIYCVTGVSEYLSCGKRYTFRPGQVFVSHSNEPHRQISCSASYSTRNILFRQSGRLDVEMKGLAERLNNLPRLVDVGPRLKAKFNRLFDLINSKRRPKERGLRLKIAMLNILLEIIDAVECPSNEVKSPRIKTVADEMRRHPERKYPTETLVERLEMSPSSLFVAFKSVTGLSPHAYLMNCRIERAKEYLQVGKQVREIAEELNFPSSQHFSTSFKKVAGRTPRNWLGPRSS